MEFPGWHPALRTHYPQRLWEQQHQSLEQVAISPLPMKIVGMFGASKNTFLFPYGREWISGSFSPRIKWKHIQLKDLWNQGTEKSCLAWSKCMCHSGAHKHPSVWWKTKLSFLSVSSTKGSRPLQTHMQKLKHSDVTSVCITQPCIWGRCRGCSWD